MWTASGVAAAVLLAGGFWGGKALSTSAATPRVEHGTVRLVGDGGDALLFRLTGARKVTGYALPNTLEWRNAYGTWIDGPRRASSGRSAAGSTSRSASSAPSRSPTRRAGTSSPRWSARARPVPHFRVVTPHSTQP